MDIIVGSILIILTLGFSINARLKEKKIFNNGICKKCSSPISCFHDSFVMRGYVCDKCDRSFWIAFSVD